MPRIPSLLRLPLNLTLVLWDAAVFLSTNTLEALKLYHEAMGEILELIQP